MHAESVCIYVRESLEEVDATHLVFHLFLT